MPRVRRQVILEDPSRPVTPDMAQTKLSKLLFGQNINPCKLNLLK